MNANLFRHLCRRAIQINEHFNKCKYARLYHWADFHLQTLWQVRVKQKLVKTYRDTVYRSCDKDKNNDHIILKTLSRLKEILCE